MKTFILKVELKVDDLLMYGGDEDLESKKWFRNQVLLHPKKGECLRLFSDCIGDEVGEIKVLKLQELLGR